MIFDVVIFGSGISAKISAIALAKNNLSVCIISDCKKNEDIHETNLVTFMSIGSIHYLQTILTNYKIFDQYEEIKEINCMLVGVNNIIDQTINFNDNKNEILGKIVQNSFLESCLDNEIKNIPDIKLIHNSNISQYHDTINGVHLELTNKEIINSKLFILSSSKNKELIKKTDIKFINYDFEQDALSILIDYKTKQKNCAFQKFTNQGPIAVLPYSKNKSSIVWSVNRDSDILKKSKNELEVSLRKNLKEFIYDLEITNIERHSLKFQYAKKLTSKNTVLIGNIAHNIHPIAGQGLNLSIKDIALLVKKITKYQALGYRVNDKILLKEFDQERRLDNTLYSFGTFTLDSILKNQNRFLNFTVQKGLNLVEKNKMLKKVFVNSATGKSFFSAL